MAYPPKFRLPGWWAIASDIDAHFKRLIKIKKLLKNINAKKI